MPQQTTEITFSPLLLYLSLSHMHAQEVLLQETRLQGKFYFLYGMTPSEESDWEAGVPGRRGC